jgi:hypothetical protein
LKSKTERRERKVPEKRGITIYFIDGSKLRLDFPKQTLNEIGAVLKLKEVLAARHIVAEVDGVLLVIPFENVKYVEAHPAPSKLPEYIIRGATVAT